MTNQQVIQTIMQQHNIPRQCIPMIAVFIIAKTPTILLAGFVLGYFMLFNKQEAEERTPKLIEGPPPQPPPLTPRTSSLEYDNEPHYASINHSALIQEEDQQDDASNASIDFENLLKFPSCPTTLPRLDTHFNFVSDDQHQLQQNNSIDWSAIHQELEYDQQRNAKPLTVSMEKEPQHPLYISPSQNDMLMFSSASSSSSSEDADVSSLLSLESTGILKQTSTTSPKTPLPPNDNNTAAILLVDQVDYLALPSTSPAAGRATTSFTSHISHIEFMDDVLLLPAPTPLPKPSLSSPGQLFKSKFQKAVNKMKKSNSNSGSSSSNSNTSSLQIQAYFPSPPPPQPHGSPRPSASARLNDHLKGRFHKLFKK
ncbi:hypothetical protein MBANPS3_008077 [Mucor bainieri]